MYHHETAGAIASSTDGESMTRKASGNGRMQSLIWSRHLLWSDWSLHLRNLRLYNHGKVRTLKSFKNLRRRRDSFNSRYDGLMKTISKDKWRGKNGNEARMCVKDAKRKRHVYCLYYNLLLRGELRLPILRVITVVRWWWQSWNPPTPQIGFSTPSNNGMSAMNRHKYYML